MTGAHRRVSGRSSAGPAAQAHGLRLQLRLQETPRAQASSQLSENDVILPMIANEVHTTFQRHYHAGNVAGFMQDLALTPALSQPIRWGAPPRLRVPGVLARAPQSAGPALAAPCELSSKSWQQLCAAAVDTASPQRLRLLDMTGLPGEGIALPCPGCSDMDRAGGTDRRAGTPDAPAMRAGQASRL